ncbi:MAG: alpha/beta hydrolase [Gorillibacterium sp.]|nr:alpha/beta hydrolase [Gorillibacterium sp.]
MPSLESRSIKKKLRDEGFNDKWRSKSTIRHYIAGLPAYPTISPNQQGFITLSFVSEGARSMDYFVTDQGHAEEAKALIIYLHGGAYFEEILPPHFAYARKLAELTGLKVIVPNYPTIPAITAKDLSLFMQDFYTFVSGTIEGPVFLIGDSAGAALAIQLANSFKNTRQEPERLILLSPWVDVATNNPEIAALAIPIRDVFMQPEGLNEVGHLYAGDLGLDDPIVSPLFTTFKQFPQTMIFIGTDDCLLPDARLLRDHLLAAGVTVNYFEYVDMMHVWPIFSMPEADEANRIIAAMINEGQDKSGRTVGR